jgi:hypothetical protein
MKSESTYLNVLQCRAQPILQKQEENLPSVALSIPKKGQGGTEAEIFQTEEKPGCRTGTARGAQVSSLLVPTEQP